MQNSNKLKFESPSFGKRLKSMIKVDFYRLFHTPLFYIMIFVSAIIPALVLTMTGANEAADAQTFTNVWQVVEAISGANSGAGLMDLATMCNINMVFIFVAIMVSIFISHDYSSGYNKSIFTVHPKKVDYVISKSIVGFISGACMIVAYVLGALVAGLISGLSFALGSATILNVFACLVSKIFLMAIFVPLYIVVAVFFKQKLWLSIIGSFAAGILFYPIAMMTAPLNSGIFNLVMCLVGGAILGVAFGALSTLILNKRDLY
ncbi:MAG: ABC transporter permease [Clostridia bacterium]|nr:ABC transporter permease [Clostridia bacterium]